MTKVRRKVARPRTLARPAETAVIVEEAGPPPLPPGELPPERELWPWMLALLALVLAGLAAAYFATRDDKKSSRSATVTTTLAQIVAPAPARATVPKPKPVVAAPARVPKLVGRPAPAALQTLKKLGLSGTTRGVFSTQPRSQVVSQEPGAGTRLATGALVTLNISKGPKAVPIPDVVGQDEAAAVSTVKAQGFVADVAKVPSNEPVGLVVAQHPVAGAKGAPGTGLRLNVSTGRQKGSSGTSTTAKRPTSAPTPAAPTTTTTDAPAPAPATVTVPDVTGKKLLAARRLIRKAGLVTEFKRVPNDLPKGTVVSQSPHPGTTAKRGAHVLVNVSLGPTPSAGAQPVVPDVTGEDEATATQDLQDAGYQVEVVGRDTTDPAEDLVVVNQNPQPGESAPAKSKVTIYVGRFNG
jgi:eukaryotic-like serine/threonine-protein kinase